MPAGDVALPPHRPKSLRALWKPDQPYADWMGANDFGRWIPTGCFGTGVDIKGLVRALENPQTSGSLNARTVIDAVLARTRKARGQAAT